MPQKLLGRPQTIFDSRRFTALRDERQADAGGDETEELGRLARNMNRAEEDDHERLVVEQQACESEDGAKAMGLHEVGLVRHEGAARGFLDVKYVAELVFGPREEGCPGRESKLRHEGA